MGKSDKIRTSLLLLIALISISIIGCTSISWADNSAISHGFSRNEYGDLIHKASKAVFPKEFTNFIRNDRKIYLYDENARDVSVEYTYRKGQGIATIYVYPAPDMVDDNILVTEYERCKRDVYEYKHVMDLLVEQTTEYNAVGQPLPAKFAVFLLNGDEQLYSLVTLTGKDGWFVLFRVSFPIKGADEKKREMMSTLPRDFDYSALQ